jgi:sec-independent protein translocase protein TatA
MFNSIGPLELGIVLLIVLIIFGPKRLPGLGKQLGTGMREFKDGITGKGKTTARSPSSPAPSPRPARRRRPRRRASPPRTSSAPSAT